MGGQGEEGVLIEISGHFFSDEFHAQNVSVAAIAIRSVSNVGNVRLTRLLEDGILVDGRHGRIIHSTDKIDAVLGSERRKRENNEVRIGWMGKDRRKGGFVGRYRWKEIDRLQFVRGGVVLSSSSHRLAKICCGVCGTRVGMPFGRIHRD